MRSYHVGIMFVSSCTNAFQHQVQRMKDPLHRLYTLTAFSIIYAGMSIGVLGIAVVYLNFHTELIFGSIDCEKKTTSSKNQTRCFCKNNFDMIHVH